MVSHFPMIAGVDAQEVVNDSMVFCERQAIPMNCRHNEMVAYNSIAEV